MLSVQSNRGRALEDLVERAFDSDPGSKMFPQNNKLVILRDGTAFYQKGKGASVDFVGVIKGIPVAVECKETSSSRLPLSESRFPEREKEALEEFERAEGRSFVVAAFWKENLLALFTVDALRGRKSLSPKEAAFTLPVSQAMLLPRKIWINACKAPSGTLKQA
jgi:recombination protein U